MSSATSERPPKLTSASAGFALAAAITVLFNTALALAKDASPPLTNFMTSLTGHHWTTHGLADLVVFIGLGFLFASSKAVEKMNPNHLVGILVGAVAFAGLGLVLWYAFV